MIRERDAHTGQGTDIAQQRLAHEVGHAYCVFTCSI